MTHCQIQKDLKIFSSRIEVHGELPLLCHASLCLMLNLSQKNL